MKVLDLQCAQQHVFEGWFASEDDFAGQLSRGLVNCPACGDPHVQKMLSAPRLNLRAGRQEGSGAGHARSGGELRANSGAVAGPAVAAFQAQMLQAMRQMVSAAEDVGDRFADQARAMHQGELEQRNIRGRATPAVAMELVEEGIDVLPLPDLSVLKETLQ